MGMYIANQMGNVLGPAINGFMAGLFGGIIQYQPQQHFVNNIPLDVISRVNDVAQNNFDVAGCSHGGRYHDMTQTEYDKAIDHVIEANDAFTNEDGPKAGQQIISAVYHGIQHLLGGEQNEGTNQPIDANTPNEGIGTGYDPQGQGYSPPDQHGWDR